MAQVKPTVEQQLDAANVKLLQASIAILELQQDLELEREENKFLRGRIAKLERRLDRVPSHTPALLRPQAG